MDTAGNIFSGLESGAFAGDFSRLYPSGQAGAQKLRYLKAAAEFERLYGDNRRLRLFSAPGRTEICGNHTDHQRGRVLAASVNLDIICVVSENNDNVIRIKSEGFEPDAVNLNSLDISEREKNRAVSLIRGVASRFSQLGYRVGGFDAYTTSNVLKGSGLSSSAAFEVAVGTMMNHLFNEGRISAVEIAQIGQYAENVYFGKPSGLMDQTASSVGGFVAIDFKNPEKPDVEPISFDFAASGHTLCIVDTKGNHADLTGEYAAIPAEMKSVARFFGRNFLREVGEDAFYENLPALRAELGDRAVLRAMHFFGDNNRVLKEVSALKQGDFEGFKASVIESGRSSRELLQNIFAVHEPNEQGLSIALSLSEKMLDGKGAWRVHGGGFAGTIQAFVPNGMLNDYRELMDGVFGAGSCHELSIRPCGGIELRGEA